MKRYAAKEFMSELNAGRLQMPLFIDGFVRKAEDPEHVMFCPAGCGACKATWTAIPVSLIAEVEHTGVIRCDDRECAAVRLHFRSDVSPEARALMNVLAQVGSETRALRSLTPPNRWPPTSPMGPEVEEVIEAYKGHESYLAEQSAMYWCVRAQKTLGKSDSEAYKHCSEIIHEMFHPKPGALR